MTGSTRLLSLALMAFTLTMSSAHELGAPVEACDTMMPEHLGTKKNMVGPLVKPQTAAPFFTVTASKTNGIKPGETITVTIKADPDKYFEGFLIQARDMEEREGEQVKRFGMWAPTSNEAQVVCAKNGSLTHSFHRHFTSMDMLWTAPAKKFQNLRFKATVVKGYTTFFTNVHSVPINPVIDNSTRTMPSFALVTSLSSFIVFCTYFLLG